VTGLVRRAARALGLLLIVLGCGGLAWSLVVWRWQDPVTYITNRHAQAELASRYEARLSASPATPRAVTRSPSWADVGRRLAREASRYRRTSGPGDPVARIRVPRLGLNAIVVNGTDHESLKRGPGRDLRTWMPGEGSLVYIAGHRTTYGAPFSEIQALRRGDVVTLELPYATFEYRVAGHRIVPATFLAALRPHGREELALQACWPRFFASHRYIARALPAAVTLRDGLTVRLGDDVPSAPRRLRRG
jgi:sortase A